MNSQNARTQLNYLWLHHRAAAPNVRRLLSLGLTRNGGSRAVTAP